MNQVHGDAGKRRRDHLAIRRVLGNGKLIEQGMPKSMYGYLGSIFGVDEACKDLTVIAHDRVKSDIVDISTPALVTVPKDKENMTSLEKMGSDLLQLVTPRFNDIKDLMLKQRQGKIIIYCRLVLTDDAKRAYGACEWVPETVQTALGSVPACTNGFNTPWIFCSGQWGVRYGAIQDPFVAHARMLLQLQGQSMVICYDMAQTVAKGAKIADFLDMFSNYSNQEVSDYSQKHAFHFPLQAYCRTCRCFV